MSQTDSEAGNAAQQVADLKKRGWVKRLVLLLPAGLTANRVTTLRMLLALPAALLVGAEAYGWALGAFLGAMALDALDGMIAEARDQHTTLGAFLDPLADKVLVCAVLLAALPQLRWLFQFPVYGICLFAVGLTLVRLIKLVWFRESKLPPGHKPPVAAKLAGKVKCWLEVTAIIVLLGGLGLISPYGHEAQHYTLGAAFTLLLLATGFGAASFWSQLADLWRLKRVPRPQPAPPADE
jgi:CDP-diacylglycerol--glycerol-3-phosphate 3-phosphatidyltransferase